MKLKRVDLSETIISPERLRALAEDVFSTTGMEIFSHEIRDQTRKIWGIDRGQKNDNNEKTLKKGVLPCQHFSQKRIGIA